MCVCVPACVCVCVCLESTVNIYNCLKCHNRSLSNRIAARNSSRNFYTNKASARGLIKPARSGLFICAARLHMETVFQLSEV